MSAIYTTAIGHTAIGVTILIIGALLQSVYMWGFSNGSKTGMRISAPRLLLDFQPRQGTMRLLRRSLRPGVRVRGAATLRRGAPPFIWTDPSPTPGFRRWKSSIAAV